MALYIEAPPSLDCDGALAWQGSHERSPSVPQETASDERIHTMRAVRLMEWGQAPRLVDIPTPVAGPGEVLLAVAGSGLCHSDLHVLESGAESLPYAPPFTLGHETSGTVVACGPGVRGVKVGENVLVYGPWACGTCWRCARGEGNLCEKAADADAHGGGLGRDGGHADFVVVPAGQLVWIGDLDPVDAAPLTDAALTPYHAMKPHLGSLGSETAALVIGAGGLGQMAVQLLRALTPTTVIVVDKRESARNHALTAGAHLALPASASAVDVRSVLPRVGATLVLDFVGIDATLKLATGVAAVGGAIKVIGLGGGTVKFAAFTDIPLECSVTLPNWGTKPELMEVVALARAGLISTNVHRLALEDVVEGYTRLDRGEFVGRAVAVPALGQTQA